MRRAGPAPSIPADNLLDLLLMPVAGVGEHDLGCVGHADSLSATEVQSAAQPQGCPGSNFTNRDRQRCIPSVCRRPDLAGWRFRSGSALAFELEPDLACTVGAAPSVCERVDHAEAGEGVLGTCAVGLDSVSLSRASPWILVGERERMVICPAPWMTAFATSSERTRSASFECGHRREASRSRRATRARRGARTSRGRGSLVRASAS